MTKNVYNSISHASNKKASTLQDSDYDHEIHLIDQTSPVSRDSSPTGDGLRDNDTDDRLDLPSADGEGSKRGSSDVERLGRRRSKVKRKVEEKRWSKKWTEDRPAARAGRVVVTSIDSNDTASRSPSPSPAPPTIEVTHPSSASLNGLANSQRGRPESKKFSVHDTLRSTHSKRKSKHDTCETSIDVLYENQRGGFLCGMPLFSSKALGFLDHAPWTNIAHKASATSIETAQVPDPSWEWAWPEWRVNHDPERAFQDEDGWEYSFMFSKMCSWHGPTWYNSCVRRRAWIRKRIKKHVDEDGDAGDGHGLTAEYFTIHSQRMRSQSPERQGSIAGTSLERRKTLSEPVDREDIRDIGHLMAALRESRIDREKMEAIESFVSNARDDLFYLGKNMKDIMAQFIFQASRRLLLAHLTTTLDAETEAQKKEADTLGKEPMDEEELYEKERKDKRIANLMVAVRAADEEVKRLEYWSDIKSIAEEGATKGAVSDNKGWNSQKWAGVDNSAPEPIITKADMPGGDEEIKERHEEDDDKPVLVTVEPVKDKGKGKA